MCVSLGAVGEHVAGALSEWAQSESAAVRILWHLALYMALSAPVDQSGEVHYSLSWLTRIRCFNSEKSYCIPVCTLTIRYSRTLMRWWQCCWSKHWGPWSHPFLCAWIQPWSVQHKSSASTPFWNSITSHPPLGTALKPPCCHTSVCARTSPQRLQIAH